MSRLITDLHPLLQDKFALFDIDCKKQNIDYIVTCTHRTYAEQDALYAQGRTVSGAIVTCAKGGDSAHNVYKDAEHTIPNACAFDICLMENGKPQWEVGAGWHALGAAGLIVGLDWAGVWTDFREYPHFQLPNWRQYVV
jgi:peptidoglycan L-alanyl-D-glutamate endopeptidase CwlK